MKLLPTSFITCQDNVFFETCGKDTVPMQFSIQIQCEVVSENDHCLLTDRLRGSSLQALALPNRDVIKIFAE